MLYPLLHLSRDAAQAWRVHTSRQRCWRRSLVVPRELCVFEAVSCRGVRWNELGAFARAQAQRLAPYRRTNGSAAVRHHCLMLWVWDEDEIDALLAANGTTATSGVHRIAETMMRPVPKSSGTIRLECSGGIETLTLDHGAAVASRWEPRISSGLPDIPLLSRPWARDRLGGWRAQDGTKSASPVRARGAVALLGAGLAATAAYAGYWGGALHTAQERLANLQQGLDGSTSAMTEFAELRGREAADRAWVNQYDSISVDLDLTGIVRALSPTFQRYGVVVRELEVREADARIALVGTTAEIDLPALLQTLEALPGFADVQLRQAADPTQAVISLRVPGFRRMVSTRLAGPPAAVASTASAAAR